MSRCGEKERKCGSKMIHRTSKMLWNGKSKSPATMVVLFKRDIRISWVQGSHMADDRAPGEFALPRSSDRAEKRQEKQPNGILMNSYTSTYTGSSMICTAIEQKVPMQLKQRWEFISFSSTVETSRISISESRSSLAGPCPSCGVHFVGSDSFLRALVHFLSLDCFPSVPFSHAVFTRLDNMESLV